MGLVVVLEDSYAFVGERSRLVDVVNDWLRFRYQMVSSRQVFFFEAKESAPSLYDEA